MKRQVKTLQIEQDKLAVRVELDLSNKHKNELAKVQDHLRNDVDSLTAVNERLTSELKKERNESMELKKAQ